MPEMMTYYEVQLNISETKCSDFKTQTANIDVPNEGAALLFALYKLLAHSPS